MRTHLPTGIVVTTPHQYRANAMKNLKARLYEQRQATDAARARSERIRTYHLALADR